MQTLKFISMAVMALLYIAAGINHFVNPDFYVKIMPPYFSSPLFWVQLSGVAEILLGVLLFPPKTRALAAWLIVAMLVVFLTVHVHMVMHAADFGDVPYGLLIARLPIQGLLIAWAWWYTRPSTGTASTA